MCPQLPPPPDLLLLPNTASSCSIDLFVVCLYLAFLRESFLQTLIIIKLGNSSETHSNIFCFSTNDENAVTYMEKLEMKAEEGRSTSKAASLMTGSWFHTELWTVVRA